MSNEIYDIIIRIVCCGIGLFFGYYAGKNKWHTEAEKYKAICKDKDELITYLHTGNVFKSK